MKTTHTISIHFWIKRKAERKDGYSPIYTRVTVDGQRAELSLKEHTPSESWCSDTGRVNFKVSGVQNQ